MTDTWTWADTQAWLEATSRAEENRFRWIMGEPELDPWERADVRGHVEAVNATVRELKDSGRIFTSKKR